MVLSYYRFLPDDSSEIPDLAGCAKWAGTVKIKWDNHEKQAHIYILKHTEKCSRKGISQERGVGLMLGMDSHGF
jgi:hypothetical protein